MPPKRAKRKSRPSGGVVEPEAKVAKVGSWGSDDCSALLWWQIAELCDYFFEFCDDATLGRLALVSQSFHALATREQVWKPRCRQIASSMQSWLPPIPFESANNQPKSFWPRLCLRLRKLAAEEKEVLLKYSKYWTAGAENIPKLRVALTGVVDTSRPLEIGCTKIGGKPHMPKDLEWPEEMAFLAQYNFEEIEGMLCSSLLPTSGMLYFFGGFEDKDEEAKVLHHPCTREEKRQKDHLKIRKPEDDENESYILEHPEEARLRLEEHIVGNTTWLQHMDKLSREEYDALEKTPFIQNCYNTLAFGVPRDSGGMLLGADLEEDEFLLFQVDDVSIQGNGYVWFQISPEDLAARRWEKINYITYAD